MDIAAVALTLSVINAAAQLFVGLRMKHCHSACCDSDCIPAAPTTPRNKLSQKDLVNFIHTEV